VEGNFPRHQLSKRSVRRLFLLAVTLTLTACARPGDHPVNSNCAWIEDDKRSLNLAKFTDRRHLHFDAVTAEDVAIRWADQRFHLRPEYGARENECMETLFNGVARNHEVDVAVVRQYSRERDVAVDAPVILSFGVIYAFAAYILAGRIRRRFPPGEPGLWVMTLAMAVGISLVGVLVGSVWSVVIEGIRLNSAHLSHRMNYLPLRRHWVVAFLGCFVVFALVALFRSRIGVGDNKLSKLS
jgi:hypothetical protein